MKANIVLVCQACRSPDLEIVEYVNKKISTDTEEKYFKVYCPNCGNETHSLHILSGLDWEKMARVAKT